MRHVRGDLWIVNNSLSVRIAEKNMKTNTTLDTAAILIMFLDAVHAIKVIIMKMMQKSAAI